MINKRFIKYFTVLLFLSWSSSPGVFAQVNPNDFAKMTDFMPPPPNANSLIQNSMASVNKNTGAPNISIPIYTIQGHKLSTNISLNYNSSGIKVDEVSGRTGMGWSLQAGGVITRTLRGSPDESNTRLTEPTSPLIIGLNCATWTLMNRAEAYSASGGWDGQPDLFNFSMNGLSGSFVFNAAMQPVPITPEKYKIEHNFSGTSYNFKITDNNGIIYFFGGSTATEKSKRASTCGKDYDAYLNNAWYLTKIEYPNGEKIDFSYTPHSYKYDNGITETMTWGNSGAPECFPGSSIPCANFSQTTGVLLSSISNDFTQVNFAYTGRSDCDDKLVQEIKIFDKKDLVNPAGKFVLSYTSVTATGTTSGYVSSLWGDVRPFITPYLSSLQEQSRGAEFYRTYSFDYITPASRTRRLSYAQDHWGYFNGKNNQSFVPKPSDPATATKFPNASADRSADENKAKMGLLERITFPTGGKQEIQYDGNEFYDVATSTHRPAAGLKVIQIDTQNPGEPVSVKKYTYAEFETPTISSLYSSPLPQYLKNYEKRYLIAAGNEWSPNLYGYCENIGLYSNSLNTLYQFQNNPISYSSVLESIGSNNEGGMVQNKFMVATDLPAYPMFGDFMPGQPLSNGSVAFNGRLKEEIIYKKGTSSLFPIKKTVNNYHQDSRQQQKVYGYVAARKREHIDNIHTLCTNDATDQDEVNDYNLNRYTIWSYWVYLQSTIETQWDENGTNPVVKSTQFYHDNEDHLLTTRIESTDGEGRTTKIVLEYPHNFPACSAMVTKNILTPVIRYTQTKTNANTPITQVFTTYGDLGGGNYLPTQIEKSTQGSSLISEGTFNNYDSKGNLLQYTDKTGVVNAIIWGYGQLYPVAKITGSTYAAAIAYLTSGSITALQTMDGETLQTELNKIRTGLPNAYVTTYTYKHLAGVTSIIDPNNKRATYLYDSFNRLTLVRDQDGNIVKRICYNYQGQVENCNIPACDYKVPTWQNTATPLRCEIVSCAYNGNQLQEQADVNPCSSTYNSKRWVNVGYNPSACTGTAGVAITYSTAFPGYTVEYSNATTESFFNVPASPASGNLGCMPVGKYTIRIYRSVGTPITTTFMIGSTIISGTEATFNNINLSLGNRDIYIGMVP